MNMKLWMEELRRPGYKLPLPLLSYPCISLLHITVRELLCDPQLISKGMQAVAQRHKAAAAVSMMDLSVEAEAFGAGIHFTDNEVPTVTGPVVTSADEADSLVVPAVGTARTGLNLTAVEKAVQLITDRPVFAGIIGPFSLAGRLLEVNEAMVKCYEEPRSVHTVLKKATAFLIAYAGAFKAAGANGIVLAEPLSGLLSPAFTEEFSEPYVRAIVEAVQDDSFAVIYHNCGNNTPLQVESLLRNEALSLINVGGMCGFEDQSYFTRVFKSLVGVNPKKYRDCRGKLNAANVPSDTREELL